jgi:putative ABC transport system ATP-binding protein
MLRIEGACKRYGRRGATVNAADEASLDLQPGDFAVVHGPSGSGKSTLLLMAGGMLQPDSGRILFGETDIYRWTSGKRNRYRRQAVGFVFQRFHLLPYITVFDNIRMALALQGRGHDRTAIEEIAERLGIAERLKHRPAELSVGEQQRTAIARAIIGDKRVILADEPTGNLDEENVKLVADVLKAESDSGRIVVLVTHNPLLRGLGNRSFRLERGRLSPVTP